MKTNIYKYLVYNCLNTMNSNCFRKIYVYEYIHINKTKVCLFIIKIQIHFLTVHKLKRKSQLPLSVYLSFIQRYEFTS